MLAVTPTHNWVRRVRNFVAAPALEHCDLCHIAIPPRHAHLLELETRRLICACADCGVSAMRDERYRRVPRHTERLLDFRLTDADWDALQIPIGMAFLLATSFGDDPVAFYPSPAGATESLLGLDAWTQLVADNPVLAELQPDVEALLVNRTKGSREYYRVPIDRCYLLVGLIRTHWRGLSGGTEAWEAIDAFFAGLRANQADPHG
ncbi:MAG: hypothetical protein QOG73_2083 [Acetobacteraceae bacterium]|nr:hypothetical protein [Acetobacteraceae bacterium]